MEDIAALEKRINELEYKLNNTLYILKTTIMYSHGLNRDITDWLTDKIEELERS